MSGPDPIKGIAEAIKVSRSTVVFTGAGISTESGIASYRGEDGLWQKYDPNVYANIYYFNQDSTYYWEFFREVRYPMLKKAKPNQGHLALAKLEELANLKTVITQNIDGLHQEAGSSSVIELHGTTKVIHCLDCFHEYSADEAFSIVEKEIPPPCLECRGRLRPAVVFFGEALKPDVIHQAFEVAESCDFMIVVGSSLVVTPAAEIPLKAKQCGARLAIINKDSTPLDHLADYAIHDAAGKVLSQIIHSIK